MLPCFFFFNDTATTEIYTLSLHDALPISRDVVGVKGRTCERADPILNSRWSGYRTEGRVKEIWPKDSSDRGHLRRDRKSTRLNSSHANISYAVFCLKKKCHLLSLQIYYHQ